MQRLDHPGSVRSSLTILYQFKTHEKFFNGISRDPHLKIFYLKMQKLETKTDEWLKQEVKNHGKQERALLSQIFLSVLRQGSIEWFPKSVGGTFPSSKSDWLSSWYNFDYCYNTPFLLHEKVLVKLALRLLH